MQFPKVIKKLIIKTTEFISLNTSLSTFVYCLVISGNIERKDIEAEINVQTFATNKHFELFELSSLNKDSNLYGFE